MYIYIIGNHFWISVGSLGYCFGSAERMSYCSHLQMVQYLQTLLIDVTTFFFSLWHHPQHCCLSIFHPSIHSGHCLFLNSEGNPPNAWMLGSEFEFQLNSSSKVRFLPYSFPPASEYSKMSVSI